MVIFSFCIFFPIKGKMKIKDLGPVYLSQNYYIDQL